MARWRWLPARECLFQSRRRATVQRELVRTVGGRVALTLSFATRPTPTPIQPTCKLGNEWRYNRMGGRSKKKRFLRR